MIKDEDIVWKKPPTKYDPATGKLLEPNDPNNPYNTKNIGVDWTKDCARKIRRCNANRNIGGCAYHYTKEDIDLVDCPACGRSRLCRNPKAKGLQTCYHHRRNSKANLIPLPEIQEGKYNIRDKGLFANYVRARNDKELLELKDLIAVIDARINVLLGKLDNRESSKVWEDLETAYKELNNTYATIDTTIRKFTIALQQKDQAGINKHLQDLLALTSVGLPTDLNTLIKQGSKDWDTWSDIFRTIEQRRKLTDSEIKRNVALHNVITIERLMKHYDMIYNSLSTHIKDRKLLALIGQDFQGQLDTWNERVIDIGDDQYVRSKHNVTVLAEEGLI